MIVTNDYKINTRFSSIIPSTLYNAFVSENAFVAGGAMRSIFANEEIKDFDIYFEEKENYDNILKFLEKCGIEGFYSANAYNFKVNNRDYQLIHHEKMMGTPEYIISHFDFTVCMSAYSFKTKNIFCYDKFLEHLARRELIYNPDTFFPLSSLIRTKKYIKRGYNITALQYLKIVSHIHSLLTKIEERRDISLLREQFNGLDVVLIEEMMNIETVNLERFVFIAESFFSENPEIESKNYLLN
jgi:hypothetical protein